MNQTPSVPNGAPSRPASNGAPPVRRPAKPPPTLFRKVNNRRGGAPLPNPLSSRNGPMTNGLAPVRGATPSQRVVDTGEVSGFSDPRVQSENIPFKDYKVVVTRKDLLQGVRHHLLHMAYQGPIDIRNDDVFQKPVHLHRRDPRSKPKKAVKDEDEQPRDGLTPDARAEFERKKEQRRKEREKNLAQVAPSLNTQKKIANKKRFGQVNRSNLTEEEKRKIQLTYEEKLPWVLEDWNGEKAFVAKHQAGPLKTHAAFAFDQSTGRYRLIPVEKVYNFQPKKEEVERPELTLEELEMAMKKKHILPDLLARHEEARIQKRQREKEATLSRGLYTGAGRGIDASRGGEDADMDFEDDFADDEEGDIFGDDDEDKKAADKKIKEDQLQANFLDFKDTRDYDIVDGREEREKAALKENFRAVRKALAKREGNYNQGSDSEDEDWTDSEEERQRLEAEKQKKDEDASRVPSGANTPSGRKEKTGSDRDSKKPHLKRPGSPNLSDASGTDASVARKKKKTKHTSSSQPTPGPSRPHSPDNASLDPNIARLPRSTSFASQGAGSDTDGGAMSDGTRTKLKLKVKNSAVSTTSPPASRPASPPPAQVEYTPEFFASLIPTGGLSTREFIRRAGLTKATFKEYLPIFAQVAYMRDGKVLRKTEVVRNSTLPAMGSPEFFASLIPIEGLPLSKFIRTACQAGLTRDEFEHVLPIMQTVTTLRDGRVVRRDTVKADKT